MTGRSMHCSLSDWSDDQCLLYDIIVFQAKRVLISQVPICRITAAKSKRLCHHKRTSFSHFLTWTLITHNRNPTTAMVQLCFLTQASRMASNKFNMKRSASPSGGGDRRDLSSSFVPRDYDVICGKGMCYLPRFQAL